MILSIKVLYQTRQTCKELYHVPTSKSVSLHNIPILHRFCVLTDQLQDEKENMKHVTSELWDWLTLSWS